MSLDQLSLLLGLFKGKPIAIVSVSHGLSGGLHPQYELRKILIYGKVMLWVLLKLPSLLTTLQYI